MDPETYYDGPVDKSHKLPAMAVVNKRTTMVFPKTKTMPRVSHLLSEYSNENLT